MSFVFSVQISCFFGQGYSPRPDKGGSPAGGIKN
jgi:hypothetical protein